MTKSAEDVKRELERNKKKGRGGKHGWFKLKEDDTKYIRIGPPWEKDGEMWKEILYHGGYKEKVYCRKNDKDEEGKPRKCAACKRLAELKSDRSTFGKKLWSLIKQRSETLWNVAEAIKIKKKSNGKVIVIKYRDGKFQIMRLSTKWNNKLLEIFADEDYRRKSILGVTHSKFGRLIKASRTGSGRDDTDYSFRAVDHETPILIDDEKRKKILKTLIDLDELVHGSSKEEIDTFVRRMEKKARILAKKDKRHDKDDDRDDEDEDVDDEEDDRDKDSDEDEEKSDSDDDGDEEEEDDSESDDDDDLERKYKKAKKKHSKKKRRDDDDEEEEDEDDD